MGTRRQDADAPEKQNSARRCATFREQMACVTSTTSLFQATTRSQTEGNSSRAAFAHAGHLRSPRSVRPARMPALPFGIQTPRLPCPTLPTNQPNSSHRLPGKPLPSSEKERGLLPDYGCGHHGLAPRSPKTTTSSSLTINRTGDGPGRTQVRGPGRPVDLRWRPGASPIPNECALAERAARSAEARI